jgi:hypothetical protein
VVTWPGREEDSTQTVDPVAAQTTHTEVVALKSKKRKEGRKEGRKEERKEEKRRKKKKKESSVRKRMGRNMDERW